MAGPEYSCEISRCVTLATSTPSLAVIRSLPSGHPLYEAPRSKLTGACGKTSCTRPMARSRLSAPWGCQQAPYHTLKLSGAYPCDDILCWTDGRRG
eukprot:scaffold154711_cov31-Tisochrysis_lutea.AAC.3